MTRSLHLLRHAKSSWDDPSSPDHDRPLAPRGRRACETIAGYLRAQEIDPELVLCSSATRALQTLDGVRPALDAGTEIVIERGLYAVSAAELLARLRRVPEEVGSVMLVNHQPAIQELALDLAEGGDDCGRLAGKFPTAALATVEIPGSWVSLEPGAARLISFVKPRELERQRGG